MTREEAIDVLKRNYPSACFTDLCEAVEIAIQALSAQPERKTGKWIDEGFYADGYGAHAFRCSECGGHIIEYDADPFCKWCGADMRGSEK